MKDFVRTEGDIRRIKQNLSHDFSKVVAQITMCKHLVNSFVRSPSNKSQVLKGLQGISNLIQFHDLMHQKLEHIAIIHQMFSSELKNTPDIFKKTTLTFLINMLELIKDEYVSTNDQLKSRFVNLWEKPEIQDDIWESIDLIFDGSNIVLFKINNLIKFLSGLQSNLDIAGSNTSIDKNKYHNEFQCLENVLTMFEQRKVLYESFGFNDLEDEDKDLELF